MKLTNKFAFKWYEEGTDKPWDDIVYTATRDGEGYLVTWDICYNGMPCRNGELENLVKLGYIRDIRLLISPEELTVADVGTEIVFYTRFKAEYLMRKGSSGKWLCFDNRSLLRQAGTSWNEKEFNTYFTTDVGGWTATSIKYPEAKKEDVVLDATIGTVLKFRTPLDKAGDMKYEVKKIAPTSWECSWVLPHTGKREVSTHIYCSGEIAEHIKAGWSVTEIVKPLKLDNDCVVRGLTPVTSLFSDCHDKAWTQKTGCTLTYKPDGYVVLDAGWVRMEVAPENDLTVAKMKFAGFLGKG